MFKINSIGSGLLLASAMLFSQAITAQAAVFATNATTENVTFFAPAVPGTTDSSGNLITFVYGPGTGDLTGAPNGNGAFLSNEFDPPDLSGSITWGFGVQFFDGIGDDFELTDIFASVDETFDLALSIDGISFSSLGIFNTAGSLVFDINRAFTGPFSFIRVTNTSLINSPDFDAAEVFNIVDVAPVPIPAALPLFLSGLGIAGFLGRRRKTAAIA